MENVGINGPCAKMHSPRSFRHLPFWLTFLESVYRSAQKILFYQPMKSVSRDVVYVVCSSQTDKHEKLRQTCYRAQPFSNIYQEWLAPSAKWTRVAVFSTEFIVCTMVWYGMVCSRK